MECQGCETSKDHSVPFKETGLQGGDGLGQIVPGALLNACCGRSPLGNTSVPGRAVGRAGAVANQTSGFPSLEGATGWHLPSKALVGGGGVRMQ